MLSKALKQLALAAAFALSATPAFNAAMAADLRIGMSADITSMDPHAVNLNPNNNIGWHVFDALVNVDRDARIVPGLAESWRAVDPTKLDLPSLVVVPAKDRIVPPDSALALGPLIPGADMLRPPQGHIAMTVGAGSWEKLSGTTAAASEAGVVEFVVEVDGSAGNVYTDDWS